MKAMSVSPKDIEAKKIFYIGESGNTAYQNLSNEAKTFLRNLQN